MERTADMAFIVAMALMTAVSIVITYAMNH